jgi:FMN-dependent NADH-azoreductase
VQKVNLKSLFLLKNSIFSRQSKTDNILDMFLCLVLIFFLSNGHNLFARSAPVVLVIYSSPMKDQSVTTTMASYLLDNIITKYPNTTVITKDLTLNPPPFLSKETIVAFSKKESEERAAKNLNPPEKPVLSSDIQYSDQAISEIKSADVIIIASPMWNFGIPASLKAWIDQIVRYKHTYTKDPNYGHIGLLKDKKLVIVSARRGSYNNRYMDKLDFQEDYLKTIFDFLGVRDVYTLRSEGMYVDIPNTINKAILDNKDQVRQIVSSL